MEENDINIKEVVRQIVRTSKCDKDSYIKINELLNLMVEAAELNCVRLGEAQEAVDAKNLRWIVLNYDIDIIRTPERGEIITIESWPSDEVSLYAIRDFRVLDESGQELVKATSRWIMMDVVRRRPVAFSRISAPLPLFRERAKESDFAKFTLPEAAEFTTDITPHYLEFDANSHINNVVYAAWIYDSLPKDFTDNRLISSLKINYKKGVYLGQSVKAEAGFQEKNQSFHRFIVKGTGELAAEITVDWKIK